MINLDGKRFNAAETAASGVVNHETVFAFTQHGAFVSADYAGGHVEQGYLVGVLEGDKLTFRYCQRQRDGRLDSGKSDCTIERRDDGRVRIVETFAWESRPGETGVNVFEELP